MSEDWIQHRTRAKDLWRLGANVVAVQEGGKGPGYKFLDRPTAYPERQKYSDIGRMPWAGWKKDGAVIVRPANGVGIMNGPDGCNGWRSFDIDAIKHDDGTKIPVPRAVAEAMLQAMGLPADYPWLKPSTGGTGWHILFICHEEPPTEVIKELAGRNAPRAKYQGYPANGETFDHIELRWQECLTIFNGDIPADPPTVLTIGRVLAGFRAIAKPREYQTRPALPPSATGTRVNANQEERRRRQRYAEKALQSAITDLRKVKTERNDALNKTAYRLGKFIGHGMLDRAIIEHELYEAAMHIGLDASETTSTIRSGLDSGEDDYTDLKLPDFSQDTRERSQQPAGGQLAARPTQIDPATGEVLDAPADAPADDYQPRKAKDVIAWVKTLKKDQIQQAFESDTDLKRDVAGFGPLETEFFREACYEQGVKARPFNAFLKEVLAVARAQNTPPAGKPMPAGTVIDISEKNIGRITQEIWDAIVAHHEYGQEVFLYGDAVARMNGKFELATDTMWRGLIGRAASFIEVTTTKNGPVANEVYPPMPSVYDSLEFKDHRLKRIDRIVRTPVLDKHGNLLGKGYHPNSRILVLDETEIQDMSAVDAYRLIKEMLQDFPFANQASYANAIAMLLTPYFRELCGKLPLFLIDGTGPGTGKGLLNDLFHTIWQGEPATGAGLPLNDEEQRKALTSYLAEAPFSVVFDDQQILSGNALNRALTIDTWQDRILGKTGEVSLPVRNLWISTGNNTQLGLDMIRRVVLIRLEANQEDPASRSDLARTEEEIRAWVKSNRDQFVSACISLVRHGLKHGTPGNQRMGSFPEFVQVASQVMNGIRVPGFLGNKEELKDRETHYTGGFKTLVWAWYEKYRLPVNVTSTQILDVNEDMEEPGVIFDSNLTTKAKTIKMGQVIHRNLGRIYEFDDDNGGKVRLRVVMTRNDPKHGRRYMLIKLRDSDEPDPGTPFDGGPDDPIDPPPDPDMGMPGDAWGSENALSREKEKNSDEENFSHSCNGGGSRSPSIPKHPHASGKPIKIEQAYTVEQLHQMMEPGVWYDMEPITYTDAITPENGFQIGVVQTDAGKQVQFRWVPISPLPKGWFWSAESPYTGYALQSQYSKQRTTRWKTREAAISQAYDLITGIAEMDETA